MNWVFPTLITVAFIHVAAIVFGRPTGSVQHRIAFASGIAGLLSIPVFIVVGLMSMCIAGGCSNGFKASDLVAIAFAAIALTSLGSLVAIGTHRKRA